MADSYEGAWKALAPIGRGAWRGFRGHHPVMPSHLPDDYAVSEQARDIVSRFGICVCWVCVRYTPSVAWCDGVPLVDTTSHTAAWRALSDYVGDGWANWFCRYCDLQPEPWEAVNAMITMTAMVWDRYVQGDSNALVLPALLTLVGNSGVP